MSPSGPLQTEDLLCRRLPLRGRGTVPARRLFGVPGAAGGGHGAEAGTSLAEPAMGQSPVPPCASQSPLK